MSDLPKCAQKAPYVQDAAAGRYAFCTCGLSDKQPFCNGAHRGTGFAPKIVELAEPAKVAWCGCKKSGTGPFCDGSHTKL